MSHTIVLDQQQIDFERTNTWNAIVRHCKIGKVTRKVWSDRGLFPFWPPPIPTLNWDPRQVFTFPERKCSCLPGQACGNVACPYMPVVTC